MKKYKIRENSIADWVVHGVPVIAFVLFIGLATGIVDYF